MTLNLPENNSKNVVILSGGLDSTILTYALVNKYGSDNVIAITFDYNQRHKVEILKSKTTCIKLGLKHKILDIKFFGELVKEATCLAGDSELNTPTINEVLGDPQPITAVPYRNLLFLTLALSFAESNSANKVFIGVQSCDLYSY